MAGRAGKWRNGSPAREMDVQRDSGLCGFRLPRPSHSEGGTRATCHCLRAFGAKTWGVLQQLQGKNAETLSKGASPAGSGRDRPPRHGRARFQHSPQPRLVFQSCRNFSASAESVLPSGRKSGMKSPRRQKLGRSSVRSPQGSLSPVSPRAFMPLYVKGTWLIASRGWQGNRRRSNPSRQTEHTERHPERGTC